MVVTAVLAMGPVWGDIAVELKNTSGFVKQADESPLFVDRVLVQLIWTASAPVPKAEIGGATGEGEFLLNSLVTTSGFAGVWPDQPQGIIVYTDADVGNADINSGYIIVRLYDNSALGWGDYYLQQAQEGTPLTEYDSENQEATVYDTAGGILGGAIDSQGYTIIPEPAVASLLMVFGGGMLLGRRIFNNA